MVNRQSIQPIQPQPFLQGVLSMQRKLIFFILAALFLFTSALLPQQAPAMPKTSTPADSPTISGTVLETMNAAGYTYMQVDSGAEKTWVAIPETTIEKGATITYHQGMVMKNFTSNTLNRTFDAVVFSPGLADRTAGPAKQPASTDSFSAAIKAEKAASVPVPDDAAMALSGGSAGAIAPLAEISIDKAPAANGYSVEEIFTRAKELAGTKVQVKGKVVKFSQMIMGKNWVHLQDGSGDPMKNSHDLVVTTGETVELDSIITIEGLLAADKDFGAGYKYAAIVEDAAIVK
jgi:hypothetical protein